MPEASEIRRGDAVRSDNTAVASFPDIRHGDAITPSDRDFLRRIASEVPSAEPNHVMLYGHGAPPSLALSVVDTRRLLTLARTLVGHSPPPRQG